MSGHVDIQVIRLYFAKTTFPRLPSPYERYELLCTGDPIAGAPEAWAPFPIRKATNLTLTSQLTVT